MNKLWLWIGRILGYLTWPAAAIAIRFSTRTRVLIICQDEVLLVQDWLGVGGWTALGGGLHRGELPLDGAVREVHEESGIRVEKPDLIELGIFRQTTGHRYRFHGYALQLASKPTLQLQASEIARAEWFKRSDIEKLTTKQHVKILIDAWQKQR